MRAVVTDAYERYRTDTSGTVADYIPVLGKASPDLFGIYVVGAQGQSFGVGDVETTFSIQSVSKPFVFALACHQVGYDAARHQLGVNGTGFPFDSLIAVELNPARTMNPLVNAGAIATTSLLAGDTAEEKWETVRTGLSLFAGRDLTMSTEVYESESATNMRNRGIARLLESYGRLYFDPEAATDVYTRQCSLEVTVARPRGDGRDALQRRHQPGDPRPGHRAGRLPPGARGDGDRRPLRAVRRLALPDRDARQERRERRDRHGVSRQGRPRDVLTAARRAGNSVRGQLATKYLAERLGLNLFASEPAG